MKWVSAEEAITALPRSGRVFLETNCGAPEALYTELAAQRERFHNLELYAGLLFNTPAWLEGVGEQFRLESLHPTAPVEKLITAGKADYLPLRYSRIPNTFVPGGALAVDAAVIQVSPPDAHGYCSLGPAVSTTLPVARTAPLTIAEVNPRCPRTLGDSMIHVSQIDFAVQADHALTELAPAPVGETERAIARHVANLVPDSSTIQIGIGGVPQAILEQLGNHRDLGVHSGMLCDAMLPLIESGVITGARKTIDRFKLTAGELLGTRTLFEWCDNNPAVQMCEAAKSHALEYLWQHERFVGINSAVEIDLTGQLNAEWVAGRQISGLGGQFDFVEAAMYSRGGVSIVAMPATAAGGKVSRIVAQLAAGTPVTTPRFCVDYVVTEFGVADLRAKPLRGRAEALIAIAHPDNRAELADALA